MKERTHRAGGRESANEADDRPIVGRSTLAETHAPGYHAAQPAPAGVFEGAAWEAVEEPPLPESEDHRGDRSALSAAVPAPSSPPAGAVAVAPPVDDPDAKETVYYDQHRDPHAKRFETKRTHAERHRAKQDRYNQADVKSDRIGKHVAARPGVHVKAHGVRDGVFTLKHATVTRYLFVKHGNKNIAQPFDIVDNAKLARLNYKGVHKKSDHGRTTRLLLNPSAPRTLEIDGKRVKCVLSWIDGMTAAWIPVRELAGNTSKILGAVKRRAADWAPHRVSSDPKELARKSKRYVIRNDRVGREHAGVDTGDVLAPGATNGDNVEHYLNKDRRKPAFGADGKRIAGKNVTRSIVAICMNLPSDHAPPVAVDTAVAGDAFFVMRDKSFHRETPVFENGKHRSSKLLHWVFGHLGMYDAHGKLVPDPSRRGWVPLRVLADAAHLETKQIEPRKN